ncbi:MAG: hypothetical protein DBY00_01005 [Flavobacteriales bacterium]|nr:MAG: hypothetical protein DBY00_09075 [Flavobacteriales bacterium]PWM12913.1 MAG: hypothetical protein DBY00_01005 [Flavobacteriales bacterium]
MIGLGSTFIIMACSIYLIVEGNEKNDSTKFYEGIIAMILSIFFDVFSNTKYKKYRKYGGNIQIQET